MKKLIALLLVLALVLSFAACKSSSESPAATAADEAAATEAPAEETAAAEGITIGTISPKTKKLGTTEGKVKSLQTLMFTGFCGLLLNSATKPISSRDALKGFIRTGLSEEVIVFCHYTSEHSSLSRKLKPPPPAPKNQTRSHAFTTAIRWPRRGATSTSAPTPRSRRVSKSAYAASCRQCRPSACLISLITHLK